MIRDEQILARRMAALIERSRIDITSEDSAHRAVRKVLCDDGFRVEQEVWLSPKERIDLLVEGIGIEIKVQGSRRDIHRQLERYAAHDRIGVLVLATGVAWPTNLLRVGGKRVFVASLSRGWL